MRSTRKTTRFLFPIVCGSQPATSTAPQATSTATATTQAQPTATPTPAKRTVQCPALPKNQYQCPSGTYTVQVETINTASGGGSQLVVRDPNGHTCTLVVPGASENNGELTFACGRVTILVGTNEGQATPVVYQEGSSVAALIWAVPFSFIGLVRMS